MMRRMLIGLAMSGVMSVAAHGATPCGDPGKLSAELLQGYREEPVLRADGATGAKLVIHASPAGTWTAMVIEGGVGCLVMRGKNWPGPRPKAGQAS